MSLVEEEDVVEKFAAQGADEALGDRVHVGRTDGALDDADASAAGGTVEGSSELVVAVADQKSGRRGLHGGVANLLCRPRLVGAAGSGDVHHLAGALVDEEEQEQRPEQEVVGLDEVAAPDVLRMVLNEGGPGLASGAPTNGANVLLDGALAERDGELEHLAADPFGAPGAVLDGDSAYQCYGIFSHALASLRGRGSSTPEETKAVSMPAQERVRLNDDECSTPSRQGNGCEQQPKAVEGGEPGVWALSSENVDLVAEQGVLDDELTTGAHGVENDRRRVAGLYVGSETSPEGARPRSNRTDEMTQELDHGPTPTMTRTVSTRATVGRQPGATGYRPL